MVHPRKERFALARASGMSVARASDACGVSSRTGAAWGADPEVAARIDQLAGEISAGVVRRVADQLAGAAGG